MTNDIVRYLDRSSALQNLNQVTGFRRNLAVVIGINDYTHDIPSLTTAVNDAQHLAKLLRTEHGYTIPADYLLVENVTHPCLESLFTKTLPHSLDKNDRLLIYFAGHGIALDGDDGPVGYLLLRDANPKDRTTFLQMTDLHNWLLALPCRHMLVILDCCFAGAFRWVSTRNLSPLPDKIYQEHLERFIRDPAWQAITSAAYDQKALDFLTGNSLGERGQIGNHSPFAHALFEALAGKADLSPADGGDGVITATELGLYLRDRVEIAVTSQMQRCQTPQLWPLRKHDKGEFIFLTPRRAVKLEPAPELSEANNPYRGLEAYDYNVKDAQLFFGRAQLIDRLAETVEQQPLTRVVGASGSGKSSLVKAGLLPKLHPPQDQPSAVAACWCILTPIRPTDAPMAVLEHRFASELGSATIAAVSATTSVDKCINAWKLQHPHQRLLLVIDQFEELVTLCKDNEREAFLTRLADLLNHHAGHLHIVLTLRSDFEPQFAESKLFKTHWTPLAENSVAVTTTESKTPRFVVPPMNQAELRKVIESPAAANTIFFEDTQLVDDLIREVSQTPGALPLLSFTLRELYRKYLKRQAEAQKRGEIIERSFTRADYEEIGGVIGSLNKRATAIYDSFVDNSETQATMQRVMLRMVAVEGGEVARRRVPKTELEYPTKAENDQRKAVLEQLEKARLIVGNNSADGDNSPIVDDAYVEPAHDALVRAWDKFLVWKREFGEGLQLQRRVTQAATDWKRADIKVKASSLWNDNPRLASLEEVLLPKTNGSALDFIRHRIHYLWPIVIETGRPTWLNRLETEFVKASIVRRARNLRNAILTTLTIIVALLALTLYAFFQQSQATSSADAANAQLALSTGHGDQAITLALKANAIAYPLAEAKQALLDVAYYAPGMTRRRLVGHTASVNAVAFNPRNAKLALSGSSDKTLILWDLATGKIVRRLVGHTDAVKSVAFSPDGSQALSGSSDQSLILWDITSGREITRLLDHTGPVTSVAFSRDGRTAASGSADKLVILWDIASGKPIHKLTGCTDKVTSVSFSPIESVIVAGCGEGDMYLWNTDTGEQIRQIQWRNYNVTSVAFSPDGKTIFAGAGGWGLELWGVDGNPLMGFPPVGTAGHTSGATSVAFSPDGYTAVSASNDKSLILWNMRDGARLQRFLGHTADVMSVAFSPDGRNILSGSSDSSLRLWDIGSGAELRRVNAASTFALSPDGHTVLYRGDEPNWRDDRLRLWDVETNTKPESIDEYPDEYTAALTRIAFSPDGKTALLGWQSGSIREFNVQQKSITRTFHGQHPGWVNSIAFSTDGRKALSTSYCRNAHSTRNKGDCDNILVLWNVETGEILYPLNGHTDTVGNVAFSPDGTKALSDSGDGSIILWAVNTGQVLHQWRSRKGSIGCAIFSPDGNRVLSSFSDLASYLWDVNTAQEIERFEGSTIGGCPVTFRPNDRQVLSSLGNFGIRWWDVETGEEIGRFIGHWAPLREITFRPDGHTFLSRSWDTTLRLWQLPPQDLVTWARENRYVPDN